MVVRPVRTKAAPTRYTDFPDRLPRGAPTWVAPLRMDVANLLDRKKNPFFAHGDAEFFLAERDGAVVGRIAAITNEAHWQTHPDERHVGFFGFFEVADDQAVADALFATAAGWLKARNLTVMRGPASYSTNDECGLMVDGYDTPPALMNPHHPPYYKRLVESAGFTKAMDLLCYQSTHNNLPERLAEGARRMAERFGITLRSMDMKRYWEEVELVKKMYTGAWEKNWGFIPLTEAEMNHMAKQFKPVVVPELVVFAFMKGEPIGMALALPDYNQAFKHNPSGRLLTGLWHLFTKKKSIHRIRVLLLGVLKQHRRTGADALMYEWLWKKGNERGYDNADASWLLESNAAILNGMQKLGFSEYQRLRMYDKAI